MIDICAISVLNIISVVSSVLMGVIFGALLGVLLIVRILRKRIRYEGGVDYASYLDDNESATLSRYIENCERDVEKFLRRKIKEGQRSYIRKKWEERKARIRRETVPIEPPDEMPVSTIEFDKESWYPFYLMAHNIAVFYCGEDSLSFLNITEKQAFDVLRKVGHAVQKTLNVIGIDAIKNIKAYTILETLHLVRSVMTPLQEKGIIDAYKYSMQGYRNVMRVKSMFSINPLRDTISFPPCFR